MQGKTAASERNKAAKLSMLKSRGASNLHPRVLKDQASHQSLIINSFCFGIQTWG